MENSFCADQSWDIIQTASGMRSRSVLFPRNEIKVSPGTVWSSLLSFDIQPL